MHCDQWRVPPQVHTGAGGRLVGRLTGEQLVQRGAEAVDVAANAAAELVGKDCLGGLGCHGPDGAGGVAEPVDVHEVGVAVVAELDVVVLVEEQVVGLDVGVDKTCGVGACDGLTRLSDPPHCLSGLDPDPPGGLQAAAERPVCGELRDDVGLA